MLKLKNAVNSFILTKKKFDKKKKKTRRMRGGATTVKKTKEEIAKEAKEAKDLKTLLDALKIAMQHEYDNCLDGLDKANNDKQSPESKIIFHKAIIHIPIVISHLSRLKEIIEVRDDTIFFNTNKDLRTSLTEKIKKKLDNLEVKILELLLAKTQNMSNIFEIIF
jgi:hypothetical protein